jgi:hypothetical protein
MPVVVPEGAGCLMTTAENSVPSTVPASRVCRVGVCRARHDLTVPAVVRHVPGRAGRRGIEVLEDRAVVVDGDRLCRPPIRRGCSSVVNRILTGLPVVPNGLCRDR